MSAKTILIKYMQPEKRCEVCHGKMDTSPKTWTIKTLKN